MQVVPNDSGDAPELRDLLPFAFARSFPMVDGSAYVLTAGSVLRFHGIEAALVLGERFEPQTVGRKYLFIGGFALLQRVLQARPEEHYTILFEPCSKIAMALNPVTADQRLGDLLGLFRESRFGFTLLREGHLYSLIGLSDLIPLYENGSIGTRLRAGEVASPRISVERRTPLKDAVRLMFERRIRRVFIGKSGSFVSDREIISYILSPRRLDEVRSTTGGLFEGTVGDIGPIDADETKDNISLKDAASALLRSQGSVLVCEKGVVSPWDLIVKPYVKGRLFVTRRRI